MLEKVLPPPVIMKIFLYISALLFCSSCLYKYIGINTHLEWIIVCDPRKALTVCISRYIAVDLAL